MANGSVHSLSYIQETVYGQTPANPVFKALRHTGTTLGMSRETLQSEELRSDRMIPDVRGGAQQVGGDIEFELSYGSFDDILAGVLCGDWTAGGGGTGVDRLKAGTVRKSFTLERKFGDLLVADKPYHRFTGVEFTGMELSVNANAIVTGSFSVLGQGMTTAGAIVTGATYPAASTTSVLDSFTGTLQEGGTTIAIVTEISFKLENGHEPRFVVGSKNSLRPSISRSNLTGTLSAYFENSGLLDKFINEEATSLKFELPDGAGNKLIWNIPRLKYMGGQPDVKGEGPILLSMPFQAILDPTSGTNLFIDRDPA